MYEFKIRLPFKIESCVSCPFRHEITIHEDVQSLDKLSGVVGIIRRASYCNLKSEAILVNESVETYNSKCPLKGNGVFIPDEK